ncbi:hypothetical protein AVEN_274645-1 [Araneus ventricosus]|uniref:F-box domain-containing protein n=1 Tax=Araneus ventricosus TaxID=182803 RepID=A0A4Y2FBX2_ARAVE|nr:hypothetical protein AVEN_274645-1 [Araneus ventricosus]
MMGCFPTKIDPFLKLLFDNRSTKSITSREIEDQWCDLPSPALENIYYFAGREDQFNMSLVCRKWSEGFRSPAVCQKFRFALTKSQLSTDKCSIMTFVKKCCCMFRHVVIVYTFPRKKDLIKTWCRRLIVFLQILANYSRLFSVEFQDLTYCFEKIDTATYGDICRAIADFLGSQYRLKRAEFYYCSFRFQEGVELLGSLTENSRESLTHLVLREFVPSESNGVQDSTAAQNVPTLECLPSLTTLEIDYSLIFENMVALSLLPSKQ